MKKKEYLPWHIFLAYFSITLFLYLFGPWEYSGGNVLLLLLYLFCFVILSTIGFSKGLKNSKRKYRLYNKNCNFIKIKYIHLLIDVSLLVSLVILFLAIREKGLPSGGDIISNMASAYSGTSSSSNDGINMPLWFFDNFGFLIYFSIILGFSYFRDLKLKYRFILIATTLITLFYFMIYRGQQKQLGDIVILISSSLLISFVWSGKRIRFTKKIKGMIFLLLVVFFFASVLSGRLIMMNKTVEDLASGRTSSLNTDNWIFKLMPDFIALGLSFLIFYVSHGFHGLELSLCQPFVWTQGLGSCSAISILLNRYLGFDLAILSKTYPNRVELATGWSATSTWHTIFPWLASDFTFVGALIVMMIYAYIYGKCWFESIYEKKWQSILLFSILNIQWFYLVANNQLFTLKSSLLMFIISLILWFFRNSRIKLNRDVRRKNNEGIAN